MYRVVLYGLLILNVIAVIFGYFGLIDYSVFSLLISSLLLFAICNFSNRLLSRIFKTPINTESASITALILFFIIQPATNIESAAVLVIVGIIAMVSKFIFAINKKHIFNPVAAAAFLLGLFGRGEVIWWVATPALLPFVLFFGFLIAKKIRRLKMFFAFIFSALITIVFTNSRLPSMEVITETFLSWPLVFFAGFMLTEPATSPSTSSSQTVFAILTGILFASRFHFGPIFSTPELALLIGNIYSYIVNPKYHLILKLLAKKKLSENIYEFSFIKPHSFYFIPGQYMEWTLSHSNTDNRGNRRYFTIASSPTENDLKIAVRFNEKSSSFKKSMLTINKKLPIVASQVSGDFILPKNKKEKLVFLAGGIGITPFRSMIKYLLDTKKSRDIILIYSNKSKEDIVYSDIFQQAEKKFNLKTFNVLTDLEKIPSDWNGEKGRINADMIKKIIPDFSERIFYLSGPFGLINGFKTLLLELGVPANKIKTDFFPGFA